MATLALLLLTCFALPASAQDDGDTPSGDSPEEESPSSGGLGDIGGILDEIDLGGSSGVDSADLISYSGGSDQTAPDYAPGKPVAITHAGGPITVYCQDRPGISARVRYELRGTDRAALERMGNAVGMRTWGSATGGGVTTRIPAASSAVKERTIDLVVNLPRQALVTVTGSVGKVEVIGCEGTVTVTAGDGAFVSGTLSRLSVTTSRGDIKVELSPASRLTGANKATAARGNVWMEIPSDYQGKMFLKGAEVSAWHTVAGTNGPSLIQGNVGSPGTTSLTVTAGQIAEIKVP